MNIFRKLFGIFRRKTPEEPTRHVVLLKYDDHVKLVGIVSGKDEEERRDQANALIVNHLVHVGRLKGIEVLEYTFVPEQVYLELLQAQNLTPPER